VLFVTVFAFSQSWREPGAYSLLGEQRVIF